MKKSIVLFKLREMMADPLNYTLCERMIEWLDNSGRVGKILIELLESAEAGEFK